MKTRRFPIQAAFIAAAAIFCTPATPMRAQDDHRESMFVYLRDKTLDREDCVRLEPGRLVGLMSGNFKHFANNREQEKCVTLFYEKYRLTLAAATDARTPATKKLRPRLRALLYAICDFMESVPSRGRAASAHARIDAYAEYLMADYSIDREEEDKPDAAATAAAHRDLVTYARLKALLASRDTSRAPAPDYARYAAKIPRLLAAAEKAGPGLESYEPDLLRGFIADYKEKLEPDDMQAGDF